jgi:hypothetical protein
MLTATRSLAIRSVRPFSSAVANTIASDAELAEAVQSYHRPHTLGPLSAAELEQFFNDGYVVKEGLLQEEDLHDATEDMNWLVDDMAQQLHKAGKIADLCEHMGLEDRLVALEEQFPHANVLLHKRGLLTKGVTDLWSNPRMLNVAEQILGPEVSGHPVWVIRCKTPDRLSAGQATVPWHQDTSYMDEECWTNMVLTAWIPLVDATAKNGCMEVVKGGHQTGRTAVHTCCVGGSWYTEVAEEHINGTLGCDLEGADER